MPKFLEQALKREYPGNPHAVYGTLNKIGAMHGNKETAKGARMEVKHEQRLHPALVAHGAKVKAAHAALRAAGVIRGALKPTHMRAIQAHIRKTR